LNETEEPDLLHHGGRPGAWGSLGLWPAPAVTAAVTADPTGHTEPADYAGACAELARALARAAAWPPGARVLAPGCGAGEELRLWRAEFAAANVVGVEPSAAQRARAAAAGITESPGLCALAGTAVQMHHLAGGGFDAVVACDSAYHFGPHDAWLQQAAAALKPGGRIAFTDLVLEPHSATTRAGAALLSKAMRLPRVGITPRRAAAQVVAAMQHAGWVDVVCTRLDDAVLGGFVRFAHAQALRLCAAGLRPRVHPGWQRVAWTARALPLFRALGGGYALFSASRSAQGRARNNRSKVSPGPERA
jgi:SAM-dependent methyltransferase